MAWRELAVFVVLATIVPGASASAEPISNTPDESLTVTVGSDGACDYANITQAVVFAPAASSLIMHIAKNNAMTTSQTITGRNVALVGGYDTCSSTTPSGHTVLDGSAFTGSVLRINASFAGTDSYNVSLFAITIINGTGSSTLPGGGMTIDGPFIVSLSDTYVQGNSTTLSGGGILVSGESGTGVGTTERTRLIVGGSSIVNENHASKGGGIGCSGRSTVEVIDSIVSTNTATSAGGGIASDHCYVAALGHAIPTFGIRSNTVAGAGGTGGGIYALGGTVVVFGDAIRNSVVADNLAEYGGGIGIDGGTLRVYDANVSGNFAQFRGGGIYASNSTTFMVRSRNASICHDALRCSELSSNRVTGTGPTASGGALFATGGTTLVAGTFIEDNRVAAGRGMAISALNAPGTGGGLAADGMRVFGSVIANSGTGGPAAPVDGSIVSIENSSAGLGFDTFSRNLAVPRIVYTPSTGGASLFPIKIFGTIFDATSGLAADPGAIGTAPTGDCNRLHESSSPFAMSSTRSTILAPNLVNPAASDYSLAANSPMLDWCDASLAYVPALTAEGGTRPYDDPVFLALYGNYDLGALEREPPGIIFANGFE
ncbi:MAG: hypothetical protein ABIO49_13285 [Dokdonella sp.]